MGNCITIRHEITWVDDEEGSVEFSERRNLLMKDEERATETKIRIKRKQLEELLRNKKMSAEKVLEELLRRKEVSHEHNREGHWKPRLQSIPEVQDER
ncbi:Porphobilinogen deaminase [Rhynchospora pubera]|uniref:Porphobilinogen deaminase n=1 Tax=Rhynchospora pubera TaxID=906938 RepID=A0AAV8HEQ5_9POAL|nr:Porphobilinogen deaminase [Rhynchospora pubera]